MVSHVTQAAALHQELVEYCRRGALVNLTG
jgi:hypothetical protein